MPIVEYGTIEYYQQLLDEEQAKRSLLRKCIRAALTAGVIELEELPLLVEIENTYKGSKYYQDKLEELQAQQKEETNNETN